MRNFLLMHKYAACMHAFDKMFIYVRSYKYLIWETFERDNFYSFCDFYSTMNVLL